jgi:hypothetical protein
MQETAVKNDQKIIEALIGHTLATRIRVRDALCETTLDPEELLQNEYFSDYDAILTYAGIPLENIVCDAAGECLVDHADYFCRDYYYDFIEDYYPEMEELFQEDAPHQLITALQNFAQNIDADFDELVVNCLNRMGMEAYAEEDEEEEEGPAV